MSVFGWSLPPGCHTLPGEEDGALQLKPEGLPKHVEVYWTEDDEILVMSYKDRDEVLLAKFPFSWNDALDDEQNISAATAFVQMQLKSVQIQGS
jgi:hypothetical protein